MTGAVPGPRHRPNGGNPARPEGIGGAEAHPGTARFRFRLGKQGEAPILDLRVNVDHVATLRQARRTRYPDPVHAALEAERAGADGITAHLREDRHHIQERDLRLLAETVQTRLTLEIPLIEDLLALTEQIRPHTCCLAPNTGIHPKGGLDLVAGASEIRGTVEQLQEAGIRPSLFVDPDPAQLEAAAETGVQVVELHTGVFGKAASEGEQAAQLERIETALGRGRALGLEVHAGHGLDYYNVSRVAGLAGIREVNIGHAIVARALFDGFAPAVAEMKELLHQTRR